MATYDVACLDKIVTNSNLLVEKLTDFYGQRQYIPFMQSQKASSIAIDYVEGKHSHKIKEMLVDREVKLQEANIAGAPTVFLNQQMNQLLIQRYLRQNFHSLIRERHVMLKYEIEAARGKMMHFLCNKACRPVTKHWDGDRGLKRKLEFKKFKLLG